MSRDCTEFREKYKSYFDELVAIDIVSKYIFITLHPERDAEWFKKIYGINTETIFAQYRLLKPEQIKSVEDKINSGEINLEEERVKWSKKVLTSEKQSAAGKLGADVANPKKQEKAAQKRAEREAEMEEARKRRQEARRNKKGGDER